MPKKQNKRRKDGRIAVQISLGVDRTTGKRKSKMVYGKTQKEADDKAIEFRLLRKKGLDVLARQELFCVWAERWIKLKSIDISKSQAKVYRSCIKHLSEEIGDMPLYKISSLDIQLVVNKLALHNPNTHKPASKKMLKTIHGTASQIFRLALDNRVLEYNPCDSVRIPSNAPETKRRALTEQEQRWIIETTHRTQCAAMIMMLAGLRRGELLA